MEFIKQDFTEFRYLIIECEVWSRETGESAGRLATSARKRAETVRNFIDNIPDTYIKQIFVLRCYDGLMWESVADIVGATGESLRKIYRRYLKAA